MCLRVEKTIDFKANVTLHKRRVLTCATFVTHTNQINEEMVSATCFHLRYNE